MAATREPSGLEVAVESLRALGATLRANNNIRVRKLVMGRKASKGVLARARAREVPPELIAICSLMDGFELGWESTGEVEAEGAVHLRSLAEHLEANGEGVDLDPENEGALESTFVVDNAPNDQRLCWIEGDLGLWNTYDCIWEDGGPSVTGYLEVGAANLFVDGWFEHYLSADDDALHPDAVRVREVLGLGGVGKP